MLHFVYSVQPHVVVAARPGDGACVVRHETSFSPLAAIALSLIHISEPTRPY